MPHRDLIFAIAGTIFLPFVSVSRAQEPRAGAEAFVNKPWELLTGGERKRNASYLQERLADRTAGEKLDILVSLLRDKRTCYVARAGLLDLGMEARTNMRELATGERISLFIRAEALCILAELGDKGVLPLVERDPLLSRPLSGLDEGHAGWGPRKSFCRSFLALKMADVGPAEQTDFLCDMLVQQGWPSLRYLACKDLIARGEEAVPGLARILANRNAPYVSRLKAIFALKEIGSPTSVPVLASIVKDPNETRQLRRGAAIGLRKAGGDSALHERDTGKAAENGAVAIRKKREPPPPANVETPAPQSRAAPAKPALPSKAQRQQEDPAGAPHWSVLALCSAGAALFAAAGVWLLVRRRKG